MYIAYTNVSCEGVVVVKDTDTKFPIGYDPYSGGARYVPTLEEALMYSTEEGRTENIHEAVKLDSAGYTRYPVDYEEGKMYRELLREEWRNPTTF